MLRIKHNKLGIWINVLYLYISKKITKPLKTKTMNTTETKEVNVYLSKNFSGYGHYKLSFDLDGQKLSATTNNMRMIDEMNSGTDSFDSGEEKETNDSATIQAIEFVLDQNGINYSSVESNPSHKYGRVYSVIYYPQED